MKRKLVWAGLAALTLSLTAVATIAYGRMMAVPEPPEISLGVMRSCAQMGALAQRIAEDKAQGLTIDQARYQSYREQLARRQPLFESPGFALLIALGSEGLQPRVIKNLGVQTCIANYYGFHEEKHYEALYKEAQACQDKSNQASDTDALNDCMGSRYQSTLAKWWKQKHRES